MPTTSQKQCGCILMDTGKSSLILSTSFECARVLESSRGKSKNMGIPWPYSGESQRNIVLGMVDLEWVDKPVLGPPHASPSYKK